MKVCGVVAEYNPFHNGHIFQLERARQMGATHIVAVMSGSVVQRGEAAIFDKHKRADAACMGGADLVVELPCPFSVGSAEFFALGAMKILKGLGVVEAISFGVENENTAELCAAAEATDRLRDSRRVRELLKSGTSYPAAVSTACKESFGQEVAKVLSSPNNTLAIEYLRACKKISFAPKILPVKRIAVSHDEKIPCGGYASASLLREKLINGDNISDFLPYNYSSFEICDNEKLRAAVFMRLISMSRDDIAALPDSSPALAAKIKSTLENGVLPSLDEFYSRLKSKNLTHARIRRILLYGALGVRRADFLLEPYARVLAANKKGMEILKLCRDKSTITVSHSLSKLRASGADGARLCELDVISASYQHLGFDNRKKYPSEFSVPFRIRD